MMNSTNFANSKQRVIRMGPRGGFYVSKADGQKKRNPVARFRKAADGSMVKLTKTNLPNVPEAIRPATPKPLGRPPATNSAKATKMFAKVLNKVPSKVRKPMSNSAKATKMFAKVLNKGPRKVRKNKGVRRVPAKPKVAPKPLGRPPATNSAKATKMFAKVLNKAPSKVRKPMSNSAKATKMFAKVLNKGPRKVRKNKGVRRVPAKPKVAPKPLGRPPATNSAKATKMFAKVLNKKAPVTKNVIVVSPGGTLYKSKRAAAGADRAARKKKLLRQNPFAALNKALMR